MMRAVNDQASLRNTHTISVDSDGAQFETEIERVPSAENPATAKITALSVVACLRSVAATLFVGTWNRARLRPR